MGGGFACEANLRFVSEVFPHTRFGSRVPNKLSSVSRCHLSKDSLANGITAGRFCSEAILKVVLELFYSILGFLLHFKPQFAFCGVRDRMFSFVARSELECRLFKFCALLLPPFFQDFAETFHNLLHILDTDALNGDRTGW